MNKKIQFSNFDFLKLLNKTSECDVLETRFFENPETSVTYFARKNHISILIGNTDIVVKSDKFITHDQLVLMDLFAKGVYYKKISDYEPIKGFFHSLKCIKNGNAANKVNEFVTTLKDAVDEKINHIQIMENGDIITSHAFVRQED